MPVRGRLGHVPKSRRRRVSRTERARVAERYAAEQGGVVHRRQLRAGGIGKDDVRSEVVAGRWSVAGRHTVLIGTGELSAEAKWWQAVWESGAGAALDGVVALLAAGMTGFRADRLDVSVPHRNRWHRVGGVRLHRRRRMPPVAGAGIARVKPQFAVLHAAAWAASDRQAALLLCLVVQQRLVRPVDLMAACDAVGRLHRGALVRQVVRDVCDGAQSLGELNFGLLCRRRGLPRPSRQAVRTTSAGRIYLDVAWDELGLVVEIDGGHHGLALNPVDDALRQNEVVLSGSRVLRIPVVGLRIATDTFMDQVVRAHAQLSHAA
jgi:very-short-patch-repair endonuclease